MKQVGSALLILVLSLFTVTTASAQTTAFTYQGSLNNTGAAATGNYDFEFKLFDALAGGTQQGSTLTQNSVAVANGVFSVSLDFGNQFPGANRFLEIRVRQSGVGELVLLTPRQQLTSTPYSVKSLTATNATQLGGQSAEFYQSATNLNAGTLATERLPNPLSLVGSSNVQIIYAQNNSNSGVSAAIKGVSEATDGFTSGVYGQNHSTNGFGVQGESLAGSGDSIGVYGHSVSTSGIGVVGNASAIGGGTAGVQGISDSTSGSGVAGVATANSGANVGVFGRTNSPDGYAGYFTGRGFFGGNVGIGTASPSAMLHVSGTGVVRARINSNTNAGFELTLGNNPGWAFATVTGGQFRIFNDALVQNAVAIDPANNSVGIGTTAPLDRLHVNGIIRVATLGAAGGSALCRNANNQVASCSSSLRYKTNIEAFSLGLGLIEQLQPITFDWKAGGMHDLGLGAEDVAAIEPLLVTHNDQGEIEGVKYDRISVVLVNAVKEQQAQIESQQQQIADLRNLVCELKPEAETCIRP